MTKIISYPSGAFGNFLSYLLNYMIVGQRHTVDEFVYDFAVSKVKFFTPIHKNDNCAVYINVSNDSYLKFLVTNINRTRSIDLVIDELHVDTFNKVRSHHTLCFFEKSLIEISKKSNGDVSIGHIREWLRLCFFANSCKTITEYIGSKPTNCYTVDFETFFDRNSITQCAADILKHFNFEIAIDNIDDVVDEFFSKQRYRNHIDTDDLKKFIQKNQNIPLNLNIVEQAWLDNWLFDEYSVDPVLRDEYFSNTKELIDFYNLPVDND
jgi:hypothetical protein